MFGGLEAYYLAREAKRESMKESVVGTCSICAGPVVETTLGRRCRACNATPEQDYGPVIPMQPRWPSPWSQDPWYNTTTPSWAVTGRYPTNPMVCGGVTDA